MVHLGTKSYILNPSIFCLVVLTISILIGAPVIGAPDSSFTKNPSHVILITVDCLAFDDLQNVVSNLPAKPAGLALVSPGLPGKKDALDSLYATLGAGDSIQSGNISQGLLARTIKSNRRTILAMGDADSDDTGKYRPLDIMLPITDLSLYNEAAEEHESHLSPGGSCTDPVALAGRTFSSIQKYDLVAVHYGDFLRLEKENQQGYLSSQVYNNYKKINLKHLKQFIYILTSNHLMEKFLNTDGPKYRVVLISVIPPLLKSPVSAIAQWDQLTPVYIWDIGDTDKTYLLTSATTRTAGLIAARDIAPTILRMMNVAAPIQMTGAAVEKSHEYNSSSANTLSHLDRLTRFNQDLLLPFFWCIGFTGGILALITLGLIKWNGTGAAAQKIMKYCLRAFSGWPMAIIIAPALDPHSISLYIAYIAVSCLIIGFLRSVETIIAATALLIILDGIAGTNMLSQSVFCYALSGIRFYGIGNEYMGALLAGVLLLPVAFQFFRNKYLLLISFVATVVVLSFPAFGAKAGGAITASATFFAAWWLNHGRTVGFKQIVAAILIGIAIIFLGTVLSSVLHLKTTHIDTAVGALMHGRLGYIMGVSIRKIGLAIQVALHPGTLTGIAAIFAIIYIFRLFFNEHLKKSWDKDRSLLVAWKASIYGSVVAVLFNDSGVVAAIMLFTSLMLVMIYRMYADMDVEPPPVTSGNSVKICVL